MSNVIPFPARGTVVPFPKAKSFTAPTCTEAEVEQRQKILFEQLGCRCLGSGRIASDFRNGWSKCPCGRSFFDGPDYDGAA